VAVNTFVIPASEREEAVDRLTRFLRECSPGKVIRVEVCEHRKRRSDAQNRALWGIAYRILSDETGHDPTELHEIFLGGYYGWEEVEVLGQVHRRPVRRSSKLNTAEFSDFYAFIQRRSAEMGYYIPDPGEFEPDK
jgi:hypothetical protein